MSANNLPSTSDADDVKPPLYHLTQISTAQFEPAVRFEAWRSAAHHTVDLLPFAADELTGAAQFVRGVNGAFGTHEASKHHTQFSTKARRAGLGEYMVISLMERGVVHLDDPDGTQLLAAEGSLAVYDTMRPMRYRWSEGKDIFLLLPRSTVIRTLGGALRDLSLPLETLPLEPFLRSQMRLMDRQVGLLARHELTAMLDATVDMAMLLLASAAGRARAPDDDLLGGLYASVLRYLEMNYSRPDLDSTTIALEVGCSRATLYRAFAAHGMTVMDSLRELRLDRAREGIERSPHGSIGALAMACGFTDPSAFGKQFKARFGMQPREWRVASLAHLRLKP